MTDLVLGIDLGNTNTSLSWRLVGDGFKPSDKSHMLRLPEDAEKPDSLAHVIRTAVLFRKSGEDPVVGLHALQLGDTQGTLFTNFKRELMDLETLTSRSIDGGREFTALDALTEVLRFLLHCARGSSDIGDRFETRRDGIVAPRKPPSITVGVPAEVHDRYKNRLIEALVASGWYDDGATVRRLLRLVTEPVAVVLNVPTGARERFVVYDHGGQTLDLALVEASPVDVPAYRVVDKVRVAHRLSGKRYDVGGTLLDRLVLRYLYNLPGGASTLTAAVPRAFGVEPEQEALSRLLRIQIDPDEATAGARDVYRNLMLDAEKLRIELTVRQRMGRSKEPCPLRLNAYGDPAAVVTTTLALTVEEFGEEVMEAVLSDISDALEPLLAGGDALCLLAGGVCQTPSLKAFLQQQFGGASRVVTPTDYSPLELIAAGLSRTYASDAGSQEGDRELDEIVDKDYGVFDDGMAAYDVIIARGTRVLATQLPDAGIPDNDAFSQCYIPRTPVPHIRLKIGERRRSGDWETIGERYASLPSAQTQFRVFFEIDGKQGRLQIRLLDESTRRLISIDEPYISLIRGAK